MKLVRLLVPAGVGALLCAAPGAAEEWLFVGSRCQAMGGACVAVSDGATAQYWNPALLANQTTTYDVQLPIGANVAAIDEVIQDLDQIYEFADDNDVDEILEDILRDNNLDADQVTTLFELFGGNVPTINGDQGFLVGADAGLMGRVKRVAVSTLGLSYVGANPIVDPLNLAFSAGLNAIDNVVGVGQDRSGVLSGAGQALANVIVASTASNPTAFTQNQAEELVFLAELAGLSPSDGETAALISRIASATSEVASDVGNASHIANNFSGAFVQGIITLEVGVAYAQPFDEIPVVEEIPVLNWFSLGGNVKYIRGETYFSGVSYASVDDVGDLLDQLIPGKENLEGDNSWGIDLGVTIEPVDWFRLGIVGRNLNTPSFDIRVPTSLQSNAFSPGKHYDLSPQARMGVMLHPLPFWERWLVSMDFDLTENTTEALTTYRSRQFSVGTEVQIPIWKLGLAPRAGVFLNTAHGFDHSPVVTFGLGLKFWNLVLDLAGGVSTDRVPFEPAGGIDEIPTRIDVSAALKWTQTF